MSLLNRLKKSFAVFFSPRSSTSRSRSDAVPEDSAFLASISGLPSEEQERELGYLRFAQHQAMIEVEEESAAFLD